MAIFETAAGLFDEAWRKDPIRLIGVATSDLVREPVEQLNMFDGMSSRWSERKALMKA